MAEKGRALPKFGEWDVNDPSSAQDFSVIFNKARNERKKGATLCSPPHPVDHDANTANYNPNPQVVLRKSHYKKWFCCLNTSAQS